MKFKNVAVCDLRGYNSVDAVGEIESVQNAALVILPKTADEETCAAFAKIEMHNVAMKVYVDADVQIYTYNGSITLSDANLPDGESIHVINGSVCVLPISPEKQVSLIVNGKVVYDQSSKNVKLLNINGKAIPMNFDGLEFLSDTVVLHAEKFTSDGENKYYADELAIVPSVPPTAHGRVISAMIVASPNVIKSNIDLEAEDILYAETDGRILIKQDMGELYLTPTLLQAVSGKLIIKDVGTVRIDKKVSAEQFCEKVLLIKDVGTVRATKATFDLVQLLARDVGSIRRR